MASPDVRPGGTREGIGKTAEWVGAGFFVGGLLIESAPVMLASLIVFGGGYALKNA